MNQEQHPWVEGGCDGRSSGSQLPDQRPEDSLGLSLDAAEPRGHGSAWGPIPGALRWVSVFLLMDDTH